MAIIDPVPMQLPRTAQSSPTDLRNISGIPPISMQNRPSDAAPPPTTGQLYPRGVNTQEASS